MIGECKSVLRRLRPPSKFNKLYRRFNAFPATIPKDDDAQFFDFSEPEPEFEFTCICGYCRLLDDLPIAIRCGRCNKGVFFEKLYFERWLEYSKQSCFCCEKEITISTARLNIFDIDEVKQGRYKYPNVYCVDCSVLTPEQRENMMIESLRDIHDSTKVLPFRKKGEDT